MRIVVRNLAVLRVTFVALLAVTGQEAAAPEQPRDADDQEKLTALHAAKLAKGNSLHRAVGPPTPAITDSLAKATTQGPSVVVQPVTGPMLPTVPPPTVAKTSIDACNGSTRRGIWLTPNENNLVAIGNLTFTSERALWQATDCYSTPGEWQRGSSKPPYPPNRSSLSMWEQTSTSMWVDWQWKSRDKKCAKLLRIVLETDICMAFETMRIKNVVIVGDSISHLMFRALQMMTSQGNMYPTDDHVYTHTNRVICGPHYPVALTYIRNDLLVEGNQEECHHGDGRTFCRHFWADVARADLAILNCGAHHCPRLDNEKEIFFKELEHNVPSTTLLVWRTTVPGHEDCVKHTTPSQRFPVKPWYNWGTIPASSRHFVKLLPSFVRILDASAISDQRFDRHISKADCLHYSLPGPPDDWVKWLAFLVKHTMRVGM